MQEVAATIKHWVITATDCPKRKAVCDNGATVCRHLRGWTGPDTGRITVKCSAPRIRREGKTK